MSASSSIIDDIFNSASSSKATISKKEVVKKDRKRKRTSPPAVETVLDTSAPSSKRPKVSKKSDPPKVSKKSDPPRGSKKDKEEDERFKDSRGTGPRRKTEEGWSIYKVDELGIDEEAGGNPVLFSSLPAHRHCRRRPRHSVVSF
ncbi:hypothetical protein D9758_000136 [Tetrapyrgos nigripes]|uniref:Uncharacterized protein n=1 Tax=Tetrapyrgos nigripes TaxID=182062 RepID=A0A8H5LYV2_9AGAR|nr:hypothetical protein D9758_000136 [Tetrapyrgos nigripes]